MAINTNNTNSDASDFYSSGDPKWDPKSHVNNQRNNAAEETNQMDSVQVIEFITCADVDITNATKTFNVNKNNKVMDVDITKITMINLQGPMLTINTIDQIPYVLVFKNESYAQSAEARIFTVMNGDNDPGC